MDEDILEEGGRKAGRQEGRKAGRQRGTNPTTAARIRQFFPRGYNKI